MSHPIRVLLQCTISYAPDDWHVGRFSLLRDHLATVAEVVARNREPDDHGDDPVLSTLSRAGFDEVWLLAVDGGDGVSPRDLEGIKVINERTVDPVADQIDQASFAQFKIRIDNHL